MSMNQMPTTFIASPTPTEEETSYQEISHVFYCMACDFQAQIDTAVTSNKGAPPGQEEIVQARLSSPHSLETKKAPAEAMSQKNNKTQRRQKQKR
jgi:hypothetical protein